VPPTSQDHEGFSPASVLKEHGLTACEKARLRHRKVKGNVFYNLRKNACFCIRARPWSCRQHRKIMRASAPASVLKEHGFTACEKTRLRHRKVKGNDFYSLRKNACFCIRARPWSCRQHRKTMRASAPASVLKEHGFTACEKTRLQHRKVKGHDFESCRSGRKMKRGFSRRGMLFSRF